MYLTDVSTFTATVPRYLLQKESSSSHEKQHLWFRSNCGIEYLVRSGRVLIASEVNMDCNVQLLFFL